MTKFREATAVCAVLVAMALGQACSPNQGTPDAGRETCDNGVDDNGDDLLDCADPQCVGDPACPIPPRSCQVATDCGDAVRNGYVSYVCIQKKCIAPGPLDPLTKTVLQVDHTASAVFEGVYALSPAKPRLLVVRFVYPRTVAGQVLTCPDLVRLSGAGTACTRSVLDYNADVNLVYRNAIRMNWPGGTTGQVVFNGLLGTYVAGEDYLVLVEAWLGEQTLGDRLESVPSGNRAGVWCAEHTRVFSGMPALQFHFWDLCGVSSQPGSRVTCPAGQMPSCCSGNDKVTQTVVGDCQLSGTCAFTEARQTCQGACSKGVCE